MVEGKVVLAVIARHFAFEKIGLTGKNGEEEVHNNMGCHECAVRRDEDKR
jgi:hypothetical protein